MRLKMKASHTDLYRNLSSAINAEKVSRRWCLLSNLKMLNVLNASLASVRKSLTLVKTLLTYTDNKVLHLRNPQDLLNSNSPQDNNKLNNHLKTMIL